MSDPNVISKIRAILTSNITDVDVLNVINIRPSSLPEKFLTIERDFAATDRITIGQPALFRETGSVNVVVCVPSGSGTSVASNLATRVRETILENQSDGFFWILSVDSETLADPDDGNYFQLRIPVRYQFDFFK